MVGSGQELYVHAKSRIPGGTQLLTKRPEMFLPDRWPSYYRKAAGADVWDLDGNRYLDMSYNGIGACVLGYADPDVDAAVIEAVRSGSMSTLNCPEEVELADLLCELHSWAEMVRFARSGGEAMAMAVRIARARTHRDKVLFCGYHGWHDWYLAANLAEDDALDGHLLPGLSPNGVPRGLIGTAFPFRYNDVDAFNDLIRRHGDEVAAVVMEPLRSEQPDSGFLETVRETAHAKGAVLVFDEVTSGFRLNTGGAHLTLGVEPDIAVFAKGMSNGYPMAAVIGRRDVMNAAQTSFVSSTYWTERIGPTAALATLRKHQKQDVPAHLVRVGRRVKAGWAKAAEAAGLNVHVSGLDPLGHFAFPGVDAVVAQTVFTQEMLDRGFLATKAFYATYAHTDHHVDAYLAATMEVFHEIANAMRDGRLKDKLRTPLAHAGFRRLT